MLRESEPILTLAQALRHVLGVRCFSMTEPGRSHVGRPYYLGTGSQAERTAYAQVRFYVMQYLYVEQ